MKTILQIVSLVVLLTATGCIVDDRGHWHHHHWARAEMTSGPELVSSPAEVSSPPVATVNDKADPGQDDLIANKTSE